MAREHRDSAEVALGPRESQAVTPGEPGETRPVSASGTIVQWHRFRLAGALIIAGVAAVQALAWSWGGGLVAAIVALGVLPDVMHRLRNDDRNVLPSILLDSALLGVIGLVVQLPPAAIGVPFAYIAVIAVLFTPRRNAIRLIAYAAFWVIAWLASPHAFGLEAWTGPRSASIVVTAYLLFTGFVTTLLFANARAFADTEAAGAAQMRFEGAIAACSRALLLSDDRAGIAAALEALRIGTGSRLVYLDVVDQNGPDRPRFRRIGVAPDGHSGPTDGSGSSAAVTAFAAGTSVHVDWASGSEMTVPVRDAAGRTAGILGAVAPEWPESTGRLLAAAADMVAAYWAQEDQLRRLQSSNDSLEREIAERRRAEQVAEQAMRTRSEFLANISHEIRTPMNGILGMASLALESELPPEQRGQIETIRSSGLELLALINDVLDLAWIEAGVLELDVMPFSLRATLADIYENFEPRAADMGLAIDWRVDPAVPESILGAAGRIRQVVTTLVSNAVKFTREGGISIRADVDDVDGSGPVIHIEVEDTGIGISPDHQDAIFQGFAQADGSLTRSRGGAGAGLAIAYNLVRLMEGRMWLESAVGQGSTFHFTVPLQTADDVPANAPQLLSGSALEGIRAIVVGDSPKSRSSLAGILRGAGMVVSDVSTVRSAVAELRRARDAGSSFPLVVVDAKDDISSAIAMREDPAGQDARIILLTSSGQRGDAARCLELGIAGYLLKPLPGEDLIAAARTVLSPDGAGKLITRHALREQRRRTRVLVAEDSPTNRRIVVKLLERRGYEVAEVEDGTEAVAAWEAGDYDLILMDVQMPRMDGIEATRTIRDRENGTDRHVPIVALTAHALASDRQRCFQAGMDAYLTKPIRFDELLSTIESARTGSIVQPATDGDSVPGLRVFDVAATLALFDGDPEMLADIIEVFRKEYPAMLADIESAVSHRDMAALRRAGHKMKGALGSIGAEAASEAAGLLEEAGRSSQTSAVAQAWSRLQFEIGKLERAINIAEEHGFRPPAKGAQV